MLAGRNVPANVLTKKIRSTEVSGGRELASIGQSSTIQRYAISIRSSTTSAMATPIHARSAWAPARSTADGLARQRTYAVSRSATRGRRIRPMGREDTGFLHEKSAGPARLPIRRWKLVDYGVSPGRFGRGADDTQRFRMIAPGRVSLPARPPTEPSRIT